MTRYRGRTVVLVQQTMITGLQEIFSGQSTPDQVLVRMDADYKAGA